MKLDKNYLKNMAKKHRKKQKGLSPFFNPDAGNVELSIKMFNHAMTPNGDFVSPDGGNAMAESLDPDSMGWMQVAADKTDGIELVPTGKDDFFIIADNQDALDKYIMELGLSGEDELMTDYGFSDEWTTCDECGRLVHLSPDTAFWKPDFWASVNGIICGDCVKTNDYDRNNYIDYLTNNPKVANTILSDEELEKEGFEKVSEDVYADGWYGQNDNPSEIYDKIREDGLSGDYVFSIESNNPYETTFRLWKRDNVNESMNEDAEVDDNLQTRQEDETQLLTEVDEEAPVNTVYDAINALGGEAQVSDGKFDIGWKMNVSEEPVTNRDVAQNIIAQETLVQVTDSDEVVGNFSTFCTNNIKKFEEFTENCNNDKYIVSNYENDEEKIEVCLRSIKSICDGKYSEEDCDVFVSIFGNLTEAKRKPRKKKKGKKPFFKKFPSDAGRKVKRMISSTLDDGTPVVKVFYDDPAPSQVIMGSEAKERIKDANRYNYDSSIYKEYADGQGRYISVHEGKSE